MAGTQSYRSLLALARLRHTELKSEVMALEAAFPELTAKPPTKATHATKGNRRPRTAAQRLAIGVRMKAAWARRKGQTTTATEHGPNGAATETYETVGV